MKLFKAIVILHFVTVCMYQLLLIFNNKKPDETIDYILCQSLVQTVHRTVCLGMPRVYSEQCTMYVLVMIKLIFVWYIFRERERERETERER